MSLPLPDISAVEVEEKEGENAFSRKPAGRGGGGQLQRQTQDMPGRKDQ